MSGIQRRLLAVGDSASQKKILLCQFSLGKYPDYIPAVFETCLADISVDDIIITLGVFDTSGKTSLRLF